MNSIYLIQQGNRIKLKWEEREKRFVFHLYSFIILSSFQNLLNIEMRLMASAALVGFPNAGKSSLLRAISRARPKVFKQFIGGRV